MDGSLLKWIWERWVGFVGSLVLGDDLSGQSVLAKRQSGKRKREKENSLKLC